MKKTTGRRGALATGFDIFLSLRPVGLFRLDYSIFPLLLRLSLPFALKQEDA